MEEQLRQLRKALEQYGEGDLRRLVPQGTSSVRAALLELIALDLELRYQRKQGRPLEDYLQRYPEVGPPALLPATLIMHEYRLRQEHGEQPSLEHYGQRFPRQLEELVRLLQSPADTLLTTLLTQHRPPAAPSGLAGTGSDPEIGLPVAPFVPPGPTDPCRVLAVGGGYRLRKRLGRGEFGEVFQGEAPGGIEVALKVLTRSLDHEASQRELKALEKVRELHHPFLLQTQAFWVLDDRLVVVMELADGSLYDRLEECQRSGLPGIPVEELVTYFSQVAEALDFLHSQRITHRDIKPQNLLHLKGYAKVADFGLARSQERSLTEASMLAGTPVYMAPELWLNKVSIHSDQYSLAATYVEMRLGRRLFTAPSLYDMAQKHLHALPDLEPLSPAEKRVLLKALAKDPGQRYPSCRAFARALAEAVAMAPAPGRPPRAWLVGVTVAGVLAVLGLLIWFLLLKPPG